MVLAFPRRQLKGRKEGFKSLTPGYIIQWLLASFCKISHHSPRDQVYGAQTPAAVQRSANPCCATPSSEENLYLFLKGMIFYNAVKASVHGDMATECQFKRYRYIKESHFRIHSLIKQASWLYNLYNTGVSYENVTIFFRNTTYIC